MRELKFIEWIQGRSNFDPKKVPVGPGDDCAIVRLGDRDLLATTDQVIGEVADGAVRYAGSVGKLLD